MISLRPSLFFFFAALFPFPYQQLVLYAINLKNRIVFLAAFVLSSPLDGRVHDGWCAC